ncbi:MAG: molecular chaperone GrpE [Actinomycetota bacterium]|nr:molecular chaperone GrpE [Actinomycetota bacterium]
MSPGGNPFARDAAAQNQSAQEQASAAYARAGSAPDGADEYAGPPVVNDRRRIDPETGGVRQSAFTGEPAGADAAGTDVDPELAAARTAVAERTADLQRLKAEFDNYRRRVERDRQATKDSATANVLLALLPALDDIGRARSHDDLNGTFKFVAEGLENTLGSLGLERFGEKGDPFDPQQHEALVYTSAPGLAGPTCVEVYRAGYRHAGRVLRPAQVVVAESPEGDGAAPAAGAQDGVGTNTAGSGTTETG